MPPPNRFLTLTLCLLTTAIGACDSASTHSPPPVTRYAAGPALSDFSAEALMTADEADRLMLSTASSLHRGAGDTLIMVPLVFDSADSLYSPEGYNAMVAAAMSAQASGLPPGDSGELYFTDYDTFQSVINGNGKRAGHSYAAMYAHGKRGRLTLGSPPEAARFGDDEPLVADVYDPYATNLIPPPCDEDLKSGGCGSSSPPPPPGPYDPTLYRPEHDQQPIYGTAPSWPTIWIGDVVSGLRTSGSSSSPGGLGHSLIVTQIAGLQVSADGRRGGDFLHEFTLSMEAVGKEANAEDEVVERQASTWFDQPDLRDAHVMYHRGATWTERQNAIATARAQNPDPYSVWTVKQNPDEWYCSKLVWYAYYHATGDSLDDDWGFWVYPGDLQGSGHLVTLYNFVRS